MVSQPQAPNPQAVAQAQTQSNQQTAEFQQTLNDVSQITPYGSTKYAQTGTASDGAPEMTATTTLSPQLEGLVNTGISNDQQEANIQGQLGQTAASTLSNPIDTGPTALQQFLDKQNAVTLDPQWATNDQRNQQQLYDQGLAPGSAGYLTGLENEGTLKNQAYAQAYGNDAALGLQANLAAYNEPLNALNALKTGSQVSQPGIGQTAQTNPVSVAGTNVAGIDQTAYQNQLAQSNATMGGLFGLGGSAIQGLGSLAMFSDRRLKRDIRKIGERADGLGIYGFKYCWGGPYRVGLIAQEVAEKYPAAVFDAGDGFLAIDYGRLG